MIPSPIPLSARRTHAPSARSSLGGRRSWPTISTPAGELRRPSLAAQALRLSRASSALRWVLLASLALVGCIDDLDQPWELTHDRVLAIRATPPAIQPGQRAQLDALLLRDGATAAVASPDTAAVISPLSLADLLTREDGVWTITAPDAARLAAARAELGLAADAPVPLDVTTSFSGGALPARKTIWLGAAAENPVLDASVGSPLTEDSPSLTLPRDQDIELSIAATYPDSVTWLTSCGTLHDFDLPRATLTIAADDKCPAPSALVVLLRTTNGGVTWRSWTLNVE